MNDDPNAASDSSRPDAPRSDPARHERSTLARRIRGLFGMDEPSLRDDLEEAIDESSADTELSAHERLMLKNVLRLHEVNVNDIMVPRADIIALSIDSTLGDVLSEFRVAEHSRMPVYGETLDDPRGMVHIRDFVDYIARAAEASFGVRQRERRDGDAEETTPAITSGRYGRVDFSVVLSATKIVRPVLFVPGSMPALDLLAKMQASRTHMALVIDEYGGTDGLVSLEDIVEVIVGEIEDEHDEDAPPPLEAAPDGSFIVDARADLADIETAVGVSLAHLMENDEIETIGGLVTALVGRVPIRGEIVPIDEALECEILDADPRRLKRLRLRKRQKSG